MFTLQQIEEAHSKVKTGEEFPHYIQEIKSLGVVSFETWVSDSHTEFFGKNNFKINSSAKYDILPISRSTQKERFMHNLKIHQEGETDYYTFCRHCAEAGVERWVVDLEQFTCIYYNSFGNEMLVEFIPRY